MCTFAGKFSEIPGISVDKFTSDNFDSSVYFLSHIHSDHMDGLLKPEAKQAFFDRLVEDKKEQIYIYSSPVTTLMLQQWFPEQKERFKYLSVNEPTLIKIPSNGLYISVIPISAGHCPGAVMFLFELQNKRILFTGDFRINVKDLHKFKSFYNRGNTLKKIDTLYLDTTFLSTKHKMFPTRDQSLEALCSVIQEWIINGNDSIVHIETGAKYGYEFLFKGIFKRFKMPVHVNEDMYNIYRYIPEMDGAVTVDEKCTQVHAACGFSSDYSANIRRVRVTAYRWMNWTPSKDLVEKDRSDKYYVCYATHSSQQELEQFIKFLKPQEVHPFVNENDIHVLKQIEDIMRFYSINHKEVKVAKTEHLLFKLDDEAVDTVKQESKEIVDEAEKQECTLLEDFSILDSPPKCDFKRRRL